MHGMMSLEMVAVETQICSSARRTSDAVETLSKEARNQRNITTNLVSAGNVYIIQADQVLRLIDASFTLGTFYYPGNAYY
jgi:hypothetical protein